MKKSELKWILKYAGAFAACVIGSGFATGQEILQFFGSYGYWSFAVVGVNLLGFLLVGKTLLTRGYDHRGQGSFQHYEYYCGKRIGKLYAVLVPLTLLLITAVLISAAGATIEQYYGLNRYLGAGLMGLLVLAANLLGFEKLVKVVAPIGTAIILFSIFVGVYTVVRDFRGLSAVQNELDALRTYQAAPHWTISAVLYLSLNFLSSSPYYTALGASARSYKSAKWGAILGAVALVLTIAIMNLAIVLHAGDAGTLAVPTLSLATSISGVFGNVFALVLMLGIFSATATTLWSFCSGFFKNDRRKNRYFSIGTIVVCMALGFLPFGKLMAVVYPLIGYIGLYFVACVIVKGLKREAQPAAASSSGAAEK